MLRIALILALLAGFLAGCSGHSEGKYESVGIPASWSTNGLSFAYPYDGQQLVAPTAPVVLHFTAPLTNAANPSAIASAITLTDSSNNAVPFTVSVVDSGQGVVLTPSSPLATNTVYAVNWNNLAIAGGMVPALPNGIHFTTRPANKGTESEQVSGAFAVSQMLPSNPNFPIMDFSTLRLQFTRPVDPTTLTYGTTVSLLDASGKLVPATVLLTDRRLSVDPVSDLTPGQTYTLQLTSGLKSTFGDALAPGNFAAYKFTPQDSGPRVTQVLQAGSGIKSPLTGAAINNVPIQSTLLGNSSASQTTGNLYAQLAFVPHYPNATPLTLRKGNILSGSSVTVQISGQVPAGLDTGAITVNVISDANGYMVANPYNNLVTTPRLVYLTMDVAMSAANSTANGAFTQNIPHVEVVGTAIVQNGKFIMDAVGVVELQVLGIDQASGVLSFHLEGYADQTTAPPQPAQTTPPSLQSWVPGTNTAQARPGDPIILNFTEPIDPNSAALSGAITLQAGGTTVPVFERVDGNSIVITPSTPLAFSTSYTLALTQQITDIYGNQLDQVYNLAFALPTLTNPATQSPFALATYPGFPCATSGRNAASSQQGTCVGGMSGDDVLPIPTLPASRSIDVRFSQSINPASVALGTACGASASFRVELLNSSGACASVVTGQLQVMPQEIKFTPSTPWVAGQMYHYVLGSNGSTTSSTATCDGTQSICGSNGLPLQTQLIAQSASTAPSPTAGGPAMDIWFTGAADVTTSVFQALRQVPNSDVNANFVHDTGEDNPVASSTAPNGLTYPNAAQVELDSSQNPPYTGLITGAQVGCPIGNPPCPQNGFTYINGALDADVLGYSQAAGGVQVAIYPTTLVSTSFNIYASATGATINNPIVSGPLVIRLRYATASGSTVPNQPITGTIATGPTGPILSGTLNGYLDLPRLNPMANLLGLVPTSLSHNLHSYKLLNISVSGPVTFLSDGRMVVMLSNTVPIPITVSTTALGLIPAGNLDLVIPIGGMSVTGVSAPVKPE